MLEPPHRLPKHPPHVVSASAALAVAMLAGLGVGPALAARPPAGAHYAGTGRERIDYPQGTRPGPKAYIRLAVTASGTHIQSLRVRYWTPCGSFYTSTTFTQLPIGPHGGFAIAGSYASVYHGKKNGTVHVTLRGRFATRRKVTLSFSQKTRFTGKAGSCPRERVTGTARLVA